MSLTSLQSSIWAGCVPLEIRLSPAESRIFDQTDPYLISYPRLSYLPLLLPRLHAFFQPFLIAEPTSIDPYSGHFTHDSVPLKWHLPFGLLYDIYALSASGGQSQPLPFKLTLHFAASREHASASSIAVQPTPVVLHDSFINSVKEADFLRSGTARPIMSLPAAESKLLWSSAQSTDLPTWSRIHNSLLPSQGQWRNIPLRMYMPSSSPPPADAPASASTPPPNSSERPHAAGAKSHPLQLTAQIKVLQAPIPPFISPTAASAAPSPRVTTISNGQHAQTLGTALHGLLPSLFPSRRTPILARPILHGAPVPMNANLEELARMASYADGWVNIVIVLNS